MMATVQPIRHDEPTFANLCDAVRMTTAARWHAQAVEQQAHDRVLALANDEAKARQALDTFVEKHCEGETCS